MILFECSATVAFEDTKMRPKGKNMATIHRCVFRLPFVVLGGFFSVSATAELHPAMAWHCAETVPQALVQSGEPRDRDITLYEYRSPGNCLKNTPPPSGTDVCRVDYNKDGVTSTLWRAKHDPEYCLPRAEGLVRDLVAAGFLCTAQDDRLCEQATDDLDEAESSEDLGDNETQAVIATRSEVSTDTVEGREQRVTEFFNSLFDASLAQAFARAAIPGNFDVRDETTLSPGNGEYLRFSKDTHAWKTQRNEGVLVINADFEHGTSFNDVFFGFAFTESDSPAGSGGDEFRYIGVVSPDTASEVVYAGEDKIIISSKWYVQPDRCYASRTTDEYHWSDSIYSTKRAHRLIDDDNPDCPER